MKTNILPKTKQGFIFIIAATIFASFAPSCTDDGEDLSASANLMIVNSAEGSAAQDFYVDDTKVNSQAVAYTQSSGYFTVSSGSRKAEFKSTGTTTVNSSSTLNLQGGKYYTVFYTGGSASAAAYTTEDDRTPPSSGKAKVRFVHLSSAAAASIDLAIQNGAKIVSGLAYKTASAYSEIDPAANFQLFAAGSANAALTLSSLGLQAGRIYTVYISGSTSVTITYKVVANN
ncbi:DUF4397 domain-containing protein [Hufsiella ginkgonis]|uniref:DUF4397 domain-containing protein n=1 Tax=Hufsiella ginkgonis TaxID=2695274 RepID=A0A7K1XRS1_9SPHI|nr:DUF4397 domain-containing protein [Hufsiella ginkgonis]MXV13695.1 DUF4397 domain-containing protein [Hufsiella ginkgonis]